MKRSWLAARAKVDTEARCRVCGTENGLQAAHLIPRSRVREGGEDARNIVPLCGGWQTNACHEAFDRGRLDVLAYLSLDEQAYAAELVGIEEAHRRLTGTRNPLEDAA